MEILSWNVNGLRAAVKKGFLEFIKKRKPDILCVQETKISSEKDIPKEILELEGYEKYYNYSNEKKGYSGVLTLTKIEPTKTTDSIGEEKFDKEGRVLVHKIKEYTIFNVYHPNGNMNAARLKYKMEFYDHFLEYIKKLKAKGEKIILVGDTNTAHNEIDLARPKQNEDHSGFLPIEREWMDKLEKEGFIDTFRYLHPKTIKYSYWSMRTAARKRNVGWRLDYIHVSKNIIEKVKEAFILTEVQGSDHCPVGIKIGSSDKRI